MRSNQQPKVYVVAILLTMPCCYNAAINVLYNPSSVVTEGFEDKHSSSSKPMTIAVRVLKGSKKKSSKKDKSAKSKKSKQKGYDFDYDDPYYRDDDDMYNVQNPSSSAPISNSCVSPTAQKIRDVVPDVITQNPLRCCTHFAEDLPLAVYITHAEVSNTVSGFEPFWDTIYQELERMHSANSGTCFVMTGYNPTTKVTTIDDILLNTIRFVSTFPEVRTIMISDPTPDANIAQEVRRIYDNPVGPSVGVFNAGYNNLLVEQLTSQQERLPFVGNTDDRIYGNQSAIIAQHLLKQEPAVPLCFNGRPNYVFVEERCSSFYAASTIDHIIPMYGIPCHAKTTVDEIFNAIINATANSIYAHIDCCQAASDAVSRIKAVGAKPIVIGCQDQDTTNGAIDYVTGQPIELQAYHTSSWVQLPIVETTNKEVFPSTQSLIRTDIYSAIVA